MDSIAGASYSWSTNDSIVINQNYQVSQLQLLLDAGHTVKDLLNAGVSVDSLYALDYQGGYIFYVEISDGSGMVAYHSNLGGGTPPLQNFSIMHEWGCSWFVPNSGMSGTLIGGTGTAIGTGETNTNLIANHSCQQPLNAPTQCYNLVYQGYDDWFLPSRDELDLIYDNVQCVRAGYPAGMPPDPPWPSASPGWMGSGVQTYNDFHTYSSSEYSATEIWKRQFNSQLDTTHVPVNSSQGGGNDLITKNQVQPVPFYIPARSFEGENTNIVIDTTNCVWVSNTGWNYITITTVNGITATDSVYVSLNTQVSDSSSVSACNTYTWEGQTITSSGDLTHTYQNALGCDSVHTLSVTINNSNTGASSVSACNTYTWEGQTITSSGNLTYTYQNISGCDSVHILSVTINNSSWEISTVISCDSLAWEGQTITSSGNLTHTLSEYIRM